MKEKRRVLFHRSWTRFNGGTSGGQLKMKDAFEHIKTSDQFAPFVYFNPETVWFDNPGNYWLPNRQNALADWEIRPTDILFFAGHDWKILSPDELMSPKVPVINIAQPRHIREVDPRHRFLKYPAIRIAKSSNGKNILEQFGVNGPVYLIPDAIDLSDLPEENPVPDLDILIVGLKNPELAKKLLENIKSKNKWRRIPWKIEIQIPPKLPTRKDFLTLVNRAKIVVCLPLDAAEGAEGFYLPALEAMAMNKLVICPYAVGNTDFCISGVTCIQPEYNEKDLTDAIIYALKMDASEQQKLIQAGKKMAANHDIRREREELIKLLHSADEIWKDLSLLEDSKSGEDILLTGIPRSGTTLACRLLSDFTQTIALNEPMHKDYFTDVASAEENIRIQFKNFRKSLLQDGSAIARTADGKITDNAYSKDGIKRERVIQRSPVFFNKPLEKNFTLIMKHCAEFTLLLPEVANKFNFYAVIRNPLAVLSSWISVDVPVSRGKVAKSAQLNQAFHKTLEEHSGDLLQRQLFILSWYFGQYIDFPEDHIVRYEEMISSPEKQLRSIAKGELLDSFSNLSNKNASELYDRSKVQSVGERLLNSEGNYWKFYSKDDVRDLLKKMSVNG